MPTFISHAAYLKKFWDEKKYPSEYFHDGFLGSMLPDIRYLTKEDREKTHFLENLGNVNDFDHLMKEVFKNSNPATKSNQIPSKNLYHFRIGLSFHVVLDEWWPRQIYYPSKFEKFEICLKLLDDILLQDKIKKIEKYLELPYDLNFLNYSEDIVRKWYNFVFRYIKKQPSPQNIREILIQSEQFKEETIKKIENETNRISNNQEIRKTLQNMYKSFNWKSVSKDRFLI